jgi:hypothetical protein
MAFAMDFGKGLGMALYWGIGENRHRLPVLGNLNRNWPVYILFGGRA